MGITSAQLVELEQAYIGAKGDIDTVARLLIDHNISAADVALCAQTFSATPQWMRVLLGARSVSQNWPSKTALGRSADIVSYTNAFKTSPPATLGSADLHAWALTNA